MKRKLSRRLKSSLCFLILSVYSTISFCEQVWYEWGLATATVGWDTDNKRTLVQKYYLAAIGPEHIDEIAVNHVKGCLKVALISGVDAYKATPSPEISARTASAYAAFKLYSISCLTSNPVTANIKNQFEPSVVQRQEWQDGLHLKFHADNPSAQNYRRIGEYIQKEFGGDLAKASNKIFRLYADLQDLNINISLNDAEIVAEALNYYATSARGMMVLEAVKDIEQLSSNPLDPAAAQKMTIKLLAHAGESLKSLDAFGLTAAGVPSELAKKIEQETRKILSDPKKRGLLLSGGNPGALLSYEIIEKLPELVESAPEVMAPKVKVGGEEIRVTPIGPIPEKWIPKL
ncbi:MAG: hypothetical protein G8D91_01875 [gamma proteobacterium symbiont of Clathrolucina costata]